MANTLTAPLEKLPVTQSQYLFAVFFESPELNQQSLKQTHFEKEWYMRQYTAVYISIRFDIIFRLSCAAILWYLFFPAKDSQL